MRRKVIKEGTTKLQTSVREINSNIFQLMTARVITELYHKKILGTCYSHKYNHNEEKILHQKVLVNVIDTLSRDKNYRLEIFQSMKVGVT